MFFPKCFYSFRSNKTLIAILYSIQLAKLFSKVVLLTESVYSWSRYFDFGFSEEL